MAKQPRCLVPAKRAALTQHVPGGCQLKRIIRAEGAAPGRELPARETQYPACAWPPWLSPVPPSCRWAVATPSPTWQYPITKALSPAAGQCRYAGCGAHSKGRMATNSYLFLPFPMLKCLVVANSAEGHLGDCMVRSPPLSQVEAAHSELGWWGASFGLTIV